MRIAKAFDQACYRGYIIAAYAFGHGYMVVKDGTKIYGSEAPDAFEQCKRAVDSIEFEVQS